MSTRSSVRLLVLLAAGAGLATCAKVPLTAPAGSSIFVQANPTFVPANGGTAIVTALVTEPAGTLVPNGTVIYFFTSLGRIDGTVQTRDGVANANFVADSRSGTAQITVWAGGPAPSGAPAASPSPGGSATATGPGSATVSIVVGSALPATVVVTADPQVLASSRQATLRANVFDANGNPVQNVPVVFSLSAGSGVALQETLDSGGVPQFSDSNGQAFDTLRTHVANGTSQRSITVTATTATGKTGTTTVVVNFSAGP